MAVIDMICMEGLEVVSVNDKVREVEGGVKVWNKVQAHLL